MKIFFWIFTLVMVLLIPGTMMFFGNDFLRCPGTINRVHGYRTRRSMASQEAWNYAHNICGRLWKKTGVRMLAPSLLAELLLLGSSVETMGMWSLGIVTIQVTVMFFTIIPVERALKQNFDQFGRKR